MKENNSISKNKSLLSILGLVLLLLLSPCKVRNYIEAELHIPQTEVVNKGITTVTSSSCLSTDNIKNTVTVSKFSLEFAPALLFYKFNKAFNTAIDFTPKSLNNFSSKNESVVFVPLYILHQNFKVYS